LTNPLTVLLEHSHVFPIKLHCQGEKAVAKFVNGDFALRITGRWHLGLMIVPRKNPAAQLILAKKGNAECSVNRFFRRFGPFDANAWSALVNRTKAINQSIKRGFRPGERVAKNLILRPNNLSKMQKYHAANNLFTYSLQITHFDWNRLAR